MVRKVYVLSSPFLFRTHTDKQNVRHFLQIFKVFDITNLMDLGFFGIFLLLK